MRIMALRSFGEQQGLLSSRIEFWPGTTQAIAKFERTILDFELVPGSFIYWRRVLRLARLLGFLRSSFVLASSIVSLPSLHIGLPQRCPSLSGGGGETSQEK